jgi:hypothetical protein
MRKKLLSDISDDLTANIMEVSCTLEVKSVVGGQVQPGQRSASWH